MQAKTLVGLPSYLIYEDGSIVNKKTSRKLKYYVDHGGYHRIKLATVNPSDDTVSYKHYGVHRLVALAFIPEIPGLTIVNHIDGDKTNNIVTNLEWTDKSGNALHAINVLGNNTTYEPLSVHKIDPVTKKVVATYASLGEASRSVGLNNPAVSKYFIRKKNNPDTLCGGYMWELCTDAKHKN